MDISSAFLPSLWSALFAASLGVIFTAPPRYLAAAFLCGFIGRAVRDLGVDLGFNMNWATAIAATVLALTAAAMTRRRSVSPVVLICGVLPLGAAVAMFKLIFALLQISTATGEALDAMSVTLTANLGKVFTTSLAIAIGLGVGLTIERLFKREQTGPA